jgi:hypothetical protein
MSQWRERLFGALTGTRFLRIISPLLGGVILAAFLVSSVSAAPTPTTYYACVNMKTGSIYMVKAGATCKKGYAPMSWNQVGPCGPQGPQGPAGPTGPQGPQGPEGPTQTLTITQVQNSDTLTPGGLSDVGVVCPTGTLVTGGGFKTDELGIPNVMVIESEPVVSQNEWRVIVSNPGPLTVSLTIYALCASLA